MLAKEGHPPATKDNWEKLANSLGVKLLAPAAGSWDWEFEGFAKLITHHSVAAKTIVTRLTDILIGTSRLVGSVIDNHVHTMFTVTIRGRIT